MKIGITNDHRGVDRKIKIIKYLKSKGYEVIDYGPNTPESVDYPIYAFELGKKVSNKEVDFGILLCGTGVGMCIAVNKVNGVRCAKIDNIKDAKLTREHNNANALAISAEISMMRTKDILDVFLKTKFTDEERHVRRINLIDSYSNEFVRKEEIVNKEEKNVKNKIEKSNISEDLSNDN